MAFENSKSQETCHDEEQCIHRVKNCLGKRWCLHVSTHICVYFRSPNYEEKMDQKKVARLTKHYGSFHYKNKL